MFIKEMHVIKGILLVILTLSIAGFSEGGVCNAYTGSPNHPSNLGGNEQSLSDIGLEIRIPSYSTSCACGIITSWTFYTRRNGTVIFYALSGTTLVGKTLVAIPELSHDNYFEIPLSSAMWISVRHSNILGFFTPALPMITYGTTGYTYRYSTGRSELAVGSSGSFASSGSREYALRAYIEEGHSPMFTNLPYTISIYTHDTGINIITVSATDLDPDDAPSLTITCSISNPYSSYFTFSGNTLRYDSVYTASTTLTFTMTASDGCRNSSDYVYVDLINEPPLLTNLPATVSIAEKSSGTSTIFTIATSDPAGETVNCYLDTTDTSITTYFSVNTGPDTVRVTYPGTNGGFVHNSRPAYNLPIRCRDNDNTVYSSLNVDIQKNEPPVYTPGSGYLPATQAVGRDTSTLYTLAATDPDPGDSVTYTLTACSASPCPVHVTPAGVVQRNYTLPDAYYDLTIEASDTYNVVSKVLTLVVSEQLDHNESPNFRNLPATIYVSENTPAGTALFRFIYDDVNTWDVLTLSQVSVSDGTANTYFQMDTNTGIVSVKAPFDYDTVNPKSVSISYRVQDGDGSSDTESLTIVYVNVNEAPSLSIGTTTITANEGSRNNQFSDPGLGVTDPDSGDSTNSKWSLDCGADSKYFYINDANRMIYLAREYDMDSGLSGSATCVVSVIDPQGLSATGTLTLSINNINDNTPKFPYHRYLFLQSPDDPFFTKVENLTATDADSNAFGSTLGTLTYSFDTVNYPQVTTYYQLDVNGILYVRDVSSFSRGDTYTFGVFAADSSGRTGTTTISILFAEVETVTTTTTQRNYTFGDAYGNYIWLFIVCIFLGITLVIIAYIVWFDPVFHDFVAFKLMRIDEWCRHKPKEPKRTVGKLTVTINNKTLENDPDNALPWELVAKDANVPEMNQVQEEITRRKEAQDMDYMKLTGRSVFEKGKGIRPASAEVEVHSSGSGSRNSSSPKYDFFNAQSESDEYLGKDNDGFDDGGPSQWEYKSSRTPVVVVTPINDETIEQETNIDERRDRSPVNWQGQQSTLDF